MTGLPDYIPLERRLHVPPPEREEWDAYDDEHGITEQRIRQQDRQERRYAATQRRAS